MDRIITYDFGEDFIGNLTGVLCSGGSKGKNDFRDTACVFGGRRPALFLKKSLSGKIKEPFYPPAVFSIDEFMEYIVSDNNSPVRKIPLVNDAYIIYRLVERIVPSMVKERRRFSQFLPWAVEIKSFIEQLDLEDIQDKDLSDIQKSASIGYDVPESINKLLSGMITIRRGYHEEMDRLNFHSRGNIYRRASYLIKEKTFPDFGKIVFCNFYYLHATERRIIKEFFDRGKGYIISQGSQDDWSVLKDNARALGVTIRPGKKHPGQAPDCMFYESGDIHSQIGIVREIIKRDEDKKSTVIIMPRPEMVIPMVTGISDILDEFNVSMGYPLKLSPIYSLLELIFIAQETRKGDGEYYSRDYLNLIRHPLVKNICVNNGSPVMSRVIIHKVEEAILGSEKSSIGGRIFIDPADIEEEKMVFEPASQTLKHVGVEVTPEECGNLLKKIHGLFIRNWERVSTFLEAVGALEALLNVFPGQETLIKFPVNVKIIEKIHSIKEDLKNSLFSVEKLPLNEITGILRYILSNEIISFKGSPLRGTQILGLMETRSLNFRKVIIMDMNEGVMPKLKIYEPLIPREVMLCLGLNRLEKEEEIQRYHFKRLISSAEQAHLIYENTREKERSRFIEELIWQKQRSAGSLEVISIPRGVFSLEISRKDRAGEKTPEIVGFLKEQTYSVSRVNTYLQCPLRFYYQYVLGIKEREDILEEPGAAHIGTFIHELLEETFSMFKNKKPVIDEEFRRYFKDRAESKFHKDLAPRMRADSFLLKEIIINRLNKFLDNEGKREVSKIVCLEEQSTDILCLKETRVDFTYIVDRIDMLGDGSIHIIDYKTGGRDLTPDKLSVLRSMGMNRSAIKNNIRSFQLPLYYHFISKRFPSSRVNAGLYNLRTIEEKYFIRPGESGSTGELMDICLKAMGALFSELFDEGIPFYPDKKDERYCMWCPFRLLCG